MDAFLDSFEQTKAAELERQDKIKESVRRLRQDTDQKTYQANNLPSQNKLQELQNDLRYLV